MPTGRDCHHRPPSQARPHTTRLNPGCSSPLQVALSALTGCAADVISGATLHKVLQLGMVTKVGADSRDLFHDLSLLRFLTSQQLFLIHTPC